VPSSAASFFTESRHYPKQADEENLERRYGACCEALEGEKDREMSAEARRDLNATTWVVTTFVGQEYISKATTTTYNIGGDVNVLQLGKLSAHDTKR